MKTTGVYAGSFDPITNGHMSVIKQSLNLFDEVIVAVGINPAKKYFMGSQEDRRKLVEDVIMDELVNGESYRVRVCNIDNQFLINYAASMEATHLIRGLRDSTDFIYESGIQEVNREMNSSIETVYLVCPPHLRTVSSSIVKGFVGFEGWEEQIAKKVNPLVVQAIKAKMA